MSKRIKSKKKKNLTQDAKEGAQTVKDDLIDTTIYDHLRPENREKAKLANTSSSKLPIFIGLAIIILIGLILSGAFTGDVNFGNDNTNTNQVTDTNNNNGQTFGSIADICINQDHSGLQRHDHFTFDVNVQSNNIQFPDDLGRTAECWHIMHTHNTGSQVHLEIPNSWSGRNPNIGDFFTIWGETLTETSLLGTDGTISMTINGIDRTSDFALYEPQDGDLIVIAVT